MRCTVFGWKRKSLVVAGNLFNDIGIQINIIHYISRLKTEVGITTYLSFQSPKCSKWGQTSISYFLGRPEYFNRVLFIIAKSAALQLTSRIGDTSSLTPFQTTSLLCLFSFKWNDQLIPMWCVQCDYHSSLNLRSLFCENCWLNTLIIFKTVYKISHLSDTDTDDSSTSDGIPYKKGKRITKYKLNWQNSSWLR